MLPYSSENEMQYDLNHRSQPRDFYLPPPLVPPPVLGDWNQPGIHSYISTPTSSASPNSLHFPPTSSYGSSTEPLGSYPATPLSSTSSLFLRNNVSSHSSTLQSCLSEIQTSTRQDFIHETPAIPKQKADKSQRSCMLCFKEKSKCVGNDPYRCTNCLDNTFYCKGPIMTPELIDLDSLYRMAALTLGFQSQHSFSASRSFTVDLNLRPLLDSIAAPNEEVFKFTIVSDDDHLSWNATRFDDVLDALVAVQPAQTEPNPLYDLALFKRLCRRFCHCVSILRCLDQCTLSPNNIDQPTVTRLVIGFICQLSRKANTLLASIFDEVRACCSAKRQKAPTQKLMFDLTDHLGEMCKEIGALNESLLLGKQPPLFHGFFVDAIKTLCDIEDIARGLRVGKFNFANRSAPLQLGGLHVTCPTNLAPLPEHGFGPPTAEVSFLDVLALRTPLEPFPNNHDTLATVTESSSDGGIAFEIVDWEAEGRESLNLGWTIRPSAFASIPNEPDLGTEYPHLATSADEGHHPEDNATTSSSAATNFHPSNILSGDKSSLVDVTISDKPDHAAAPKNQTTQKPSKRRRMSSLLSRKKQCMSSSQLIEAEDGGNADTQPKSQRHTQPNAGASSTLAQIARSLAKVKRLSNVRTPRIIKTDWVASWDNAGVRDCEIVNAGIVRDVNIPQYSRRPVSWPLRHHLRNSLDMSVAALGKLRIDSGPGL